MNVVPVVHDPGDAVSVRPTVAEPVIFGDALHIQPYDTFELVDRLIVPTHPDRDTQPHIPADGEASVPEIEVDENVAPRPEEEIADVARAEPDTTDHSHPVD
ncbi:hypothetical protein MK786_09045 [Microbacterium sp. CFH 31415]|uniref:hypothetical protein n=1 Tax=Microbacterium sp. CFH 31415 TaxID=2921732 RepID=UPI001F13E5CE|nr:hypothetical protein [Microbacterium sp. CFH 31415]MCH6230881.1 hypothetical protein [Microbacterium sp. CFH 31415]